jgi:uncharacterized protein (DUF1778 family)
VSIFVIEVTFMTRTTPARRSDNINIRVTPEMLSVIDRAANAFGKTRTDFILDTVRRAAEDALLDQRLFVMGPDEWTDFCAALDAPPAGDSKFEALLARKPAWEK